MSTTRLSPYHKYIVSSVKRGAVNLNIYLRYPEKVVMMERRGNGGLYTVDINGNTEGIATQMQADLKAGSFEVSVGKKTYKGYALKDVRGINICIHFIEGFYRGPVKVTSISLDQLVEKTIKENS